VVDRKKSPQMWVMVGFLVLSAGVFVATTMRVTGEGGASAASVVTSQFVPWTLLMIGTAICAILSVMATAKRR